MCGRFVDPNLRNTEVDFAELKIDPFPARIIDRERRFNVKPTNDVLILRPGQADLARWWLIPSWHRGEAKDWKAATFNARIEEAAKKPSFRGPWRQGRCLIPAGGYYEWTGTTPKQPHFIGSAGNAETLVFAGLVSPWRDILTCTIVTRAANDSVRDVHDRMPVILNPEEQEAWLSGSDDIAIGAGAQLRHHPVQRFGIRDDGPDLIEPAD
jgi:putative SOS response-associated peptidase YedK